MKYTIATIVLAASGVLVLGVSEIHEQRAVQTTAMMKGTVSALSQQQLAVARRQCEPQPEHTIFTVEYCTEVQRILEGQPLQVVIRPPSFVFF